MDNKENEIPEFAYDNTYQIANNLEADLIEEKQILLQNMMRTIAILNDVFRDCPSLVNIFTNHISKFLINIDNEHKVVELILEYLDYLFELDIEDKIKDEDYDELLTYCDTFADNFLIRSKEYEELFSYFARIIKTSHIESDIYSLNDPTPGTTSSDVLKLQKHIETQKKGL